MDIVDGVLPVYRGRGLNQLCKMRDPTGAYYTVTGVTFQVIEVEPARLTGTFAVVATGADAYEMRMTGAWSEEWPPGEGDVVSFRVIPSDANFPFPKINLRLV